MVLDLIEEFAKNMGNTSTEETEIKCTRTQTFDMNGKNVPTNVIDGPMTFDIWIMCCGFCPLALEVMISHVIRRWLYYQFSWVGLRAKNYIILFTPSVN